MLPKEKERNIIETSDSKSIEKKGRKTSRVPREKNWGPVQPVRRSKRFNHDGVSMLEKAQDVKRKKNWKWKKVKNQSLLFQQSLIHIASIVGLEIDDSQSDSTSRMEELLDLEVERNRNFTSNYNHVNCDRKVCLGMQSPNDREVDHNTDFQIGDCSQLDQNVSSFPVLEMLLQEALNQPLLMMPPK